MNKFLPIPKPEASEKESDFVSRCIRFLKNENTGRPDEQIQAICYSAWRDKTKASFNMEYLSCLHKLEASNGKHLATFYLMNTSRNRNKWRVTDKALLEALPTLPNKILGIGQNYQTGHHKNPVPIGKWVNFSKPNGYATGTVEITDQTAWEMLKQRRLGAISAVINPYYVTCSSCKTALHSIEELQTHPCIEAGQAIGEVESFTFSHFDFVDVPAYPQAGILNMNANAEGIINPITLCASAYESQFQNNGAPGSSGTNPVKTREGEKMEKIEELQAKLDEAQDKNKTLKAELQTIKESLEAKAKPEESAELKQLSAELKQAQDELKAIRDAKHEDLLTAAVDKRFMAKLAEKKEDERKRLESVPDSVLQMLASDADAIITRIKAEPPVGPRTRYTADKDGVDDFTKAVLKARAERGFIPKKLEAS